MTASHTVPPDEHGVVRVFALNLDDAAAKPWRAGEAPVIAKALGVEAIDPDHVDVLRLKDMHPMTLSGYLTEGIGLPADLVAPDRARLDALSGHAVVILSRAFGGKEAALNPTEVVTHIATYTEPPTLPSFDDLTTASAAGTLAPQEGAESPPFRATTAWAVLVALGMIAVLVLSIVLFYV